MPVPTTSLKIFETHLRDLGLCKDMDLAIHSNMITFGRIEGGLNGVYQTVRKIIGPNATIVVPTYNLSLTPDIPYDPLKTSASAMGVFSNFMMQREGSVRTLCSMHSHVIEGPKENILLSADANQSIGPGSIFQVMMQENFHLLLLGCTFHEGATFAHHAEACIGVSYREWLNLPRKVVKPDGSIQDVIVRYYGRKKDINLVTDLRQLETAIKKTKICTHVLFNQATSYRMLLNDFYKTIQELLKQNPNIMMVQNGN